MAEINSVSSSFTSTNAPDDSITTTDVTTNTVSNKEGEKSIVSIISSDSKFKDGEVVSTDKSLISTISSTVSSASDDEKLQSEIGPSNESLQNDAMVFLQIRSFVDDLHTVFGSKSKPLQLFQRLIQKTTDQHIEQRKKFITCFKTFFTKNNDAVLEKNATKLQDANIKYPSNSNIDIRIDLKHILHQADNDSKDSIWSHLRLINASFDESSAAKDALKNSLEQDTPETKLISNIMSKIESNIGDNVNTSDPMASMMSIMTSGVFTDIIGTMSTSMKSGNIDINRMFGSLQTVMSSIQGQSQNKSSE